MANNNLYSKDVYVNYNFNKSEITNFLLHNSDYDNIPTPNQGEDIGLIYYDTLLERILIWTGSVFKIVKYLDDRDLTSRENLYITDVWMEVDNIPTTLSDAQTSGIVDFVNWATTTYIQKSYSFSIDNFMDIIEYDKFGSFYQPVIQANNGALIPNDFKGMVIKGGVLTFTQGFKDTIYPNILISPTLLPKVSYWKYTGVKGSFNFIGGSTNIFEFSPTTLPYNQVAVPLNVNNGTVLSVTINGVLIYDYDIVDISGVNYLIMDESQLGYSLETDDCIRVEASA